jgi:hypothetical protein
MAQGKPILIQKRSFITSTAALHGGFLRGIRNLCYAAEGDCTASHYHGRPLETVIRDIAIRIGIGNIGGVTRSNIDVTRESLRFRTGYGTALGMLWLCGLMATVLYFGMQAEDKKRNRDERDGRLSLPKAHLENGYAHPDFRYSV